MVTDNEHLKNPNKSGYRSNRNTGQFFRGGRYKPAEYDPSKISIIDEKNKSVRKKMVVPFPISGKQMYNHDIGILNSSMKHTFSLDPKTYLNASLNKRLYNQGWKDTPIEEAICEETGKTGKIQTHKKLSDAFSFADYMDELGLEEKEDRIAWFKTMYETEWEDVTDKNGKVTPMLKSFKVLPSKTPFLNDAQREYMEQQFSTKTVKSRGINRTTQNTFSPQLNEWFRKRGRHGERTGLPPLVEITRNFVQVDEIVDSNYDEKKDEMTHQYATKIVSTDLVEDMNKKSSPNYQRYIIDRKTANEKKIGVKDYHRNACRVCGKRQHTAKNCDLWDETIMEFKEAYDDETTTGRAISFEFTLFERPLVYTIPRYDEYGQHAYNKDPQYSFVQKTKNGKSMLKLEVSMRDARKNMATLMLWNEEAVAFAMWMNNRTLGEDWMDKVSAGKNLKEQVDEWYAIKGGGTDRLTDNRLIFYAHEAWVKRGSSYRTGKVYKGADAYTKTISINPAKGSYLEYTGQEYEFIPADKRSDIDDMYKRITSGKREKLIG
jgi:hypothetical protein